MLNLDHNRPFMGFGKIPRLFRDIVITEKLDGTNAQIVINDEGTEIVAIGSRNRHISPGDDNYGFAKWVEANQEELLKLGPGHHFGEWWGQGIQRNYGLKEKRFSLFNVGRWGATTLPSICHVVPTMYQGHFSVTWIEAALDDLRTNGSKAAPGFMKPEGIIVYHEQGRNLYKVTCEDDHKPKGL